jgi:hypothetical protein
LERPHILQHLHPHPSYALKPRTSGAAPREAEADFFRRIG